MIDPRSVRDEERARIENLAAQVLETTGDLAAIEDARELRPSSREDGPRLWYVLAGADELHIVKIQSSAMGAGWGTALLLAVARKHPGRSKWTATSINVESQGFWEKMRDRLGIELQIVEARPSRR